MTDRVRTLAEAVGATLLPYPDQRQLVAFTLHEDGHITVEAASGATYRIATAAERRAAGMSEFCPALTADQLLGVFKTMNPHQARLRPGVRFLIETKIIREAGRA